MAGAGGDQDQLTLNIESIELKGENVRNRWTF